MGIPKTLYGTPRTVPVDPETGWGEMTQVEVDEIDTLEGNFVKSGTEYIPKSKITSVTVNANDTLSPSVPKLRLNGASAGVSLSVTTAISNGATNGQQLRLEGGANSVIVPTGANTQLNGPCILAQFEHLDLEWNSTQADWLEVSRSA